MNRWERDVIPTGTSGSALAEAHQAELDAALVRDNTLEVEASLARLHLHGVGRIKGQGGTLSQDGGVLRVANGWFVAGPGTADEEDEAFFPGARLAEIAGANGFIELTGADAPPVSKEETHGYMDWYGNVVWYDAKPATRPDGYPWYLGWVTTDANGVTAVTDGIADVLPSVSELYQMFLAGGLGGGGGGGSAFWESLARTSVDPTTISSYIATVIQAHLTQYHSEAGGGGGSVTPPEVRDEIIVNVMHSMGLHQMSVNNAFEVIPPHFLLVVSPGRGTGAQSYDSLTDEVLTTMPVNTTTHEFGSAG